MSKVKRSLCFVVLLLLFISFSACSSNSDTKVGDDGYFAQMAWYFGNTWPLNFWNSEWDTLEEDLDRILEDGFNTVGIVVPWREFQPGIEPVEFNEDAFDRLDFLLKTCEEKGLKVLLRLAYYWDFYDLDESYPDLHRAEGLLEGNGEYYNAWNEYIGRFYEISKKHKNIVGSILCWEDFWVIYHKYSEGGRTKEQAIAEAKQYRYQEYLEQSFSLEEVNQFYREDFSDFTEVYFPEATQPAMELYMKYYDDFLMNDILIPSQEIYPDLSMEIRADADVLFDNNGEMTGYYSHSSTYPAGNASYTSSIYAVPMGFANQGETVTAAEAWHMMNNILSGIRENANEKPLLINQFLFTDNTLQFEHNAKVKQEELPMFVESSAEVFVADTCGYGIWTYRDYKMSLLYNSQFALMDEGWTITGTHKFVEMEGNQKLLLEEGASLRQKRPDRFHINGENFTFGLDIQPVSDSMVLEIVVDDNTYTIRATEQGYYEVEIGFIEKKDILINIVEGDGYLDNLSLYYAVQNGFVYDEDWNELEMAQSIRKLNDETKRLLAEAAA